MQLTSINFLKIFHITIFRYYHLLVLTLFFILVISLAASAVAADTMVRADPQNTGVYDNGGIVPTNIELWHFKIGKMEHLDMGKLSSPVVLNGVVYAGGSSGVYAIDAMTGKEKWTFANAGGSPAVSNNTIYATSYLSLFAIDAMTREKKWRFDTGDSIESEPIVADGVVYISSSDLNLYAIDTVTGKEKWRFNSRTLRATPAVANGVVYIAGCSEKYLIAIDAETGIEKWRFASGDSENSLPVVANGVVFVKAGGKLHAIDAVTGKENWIFKTNDYYFTSPAVAKGIVYVWSYQGLSAVDLTTGKEKWKVAAGFASGSSPAVSNGVVYVTTGNGNLSAIDAITGKEKWRLHINNPDLSSSWTLVSQPAISNGVVYFGVLDRKEEGYLYAIGRAPSTVNNATSIPITSDISSTNTSWAENPIEIFPVVIILLFLLSCGAGYGIYLMKIKKSKVKIPPDHHDVFISYSNKDKPVADAICASLESHSIRCWIAPRDVLPGEDFPKAIIHAINGSKIMVLIFSSHANTSPHVARELTKAVQNEVIIIPFRIEDVPLSESMEYLRGLPHWLDALTPPLEEHIDILIQSVSAVLENQE
jgi:outer membrane protein assembly factor BamB